jgi:carbon storage regulator CsrA
MLVLSRRPDEKILLPTVPAFIKVVSANAGLVRLGFEAPADVPILREELTRDERALPLIYVDDEDGSPPDLLRNRLSNLTLATTLLRMQLMECDPLVRKTLDRIEEDLRALRRAVRASGRETVVA